MELNPQPGEGQSRQLLTEQHLSHQDKSYLEVILFDIFKENPRITDLKRVLSGDFCYFPAEDQINRKATTSGAPIALPRSEI